jgi:hypothetical protein
MNIYIPQKIDPFNTHLKNLAEAYSLKGVRIISGYEIFVSGLDIPDVIHFHQIEGLLKFLKFDVKVFFERLKFFENKGVVFLFTAHNLQPHSNLGNVDFNDLYSNLFNYVSIFIHHGSSSVGILQKNYPAISGKCHIVCHHGDYLADMKDFHESCDSSRHILRLPLNKKIILVFGQLQFKNTLFAEAVFDRVRKKHPDAILIMAGVFPIFRYNRLNKIYYKFNNSLLNFFRFRKRLIHKRFTQHETYLLFIASDVVFLPHKTGLTTGIIPLAATLGKPFAYPDIGVFSEQAELCKAEKYTKENVEEASDAIVSILSSGINSFDNSKWLENNNWKRHAEHVLAMLSRDFKLTGENSQHL